MSAVECRAGRCSCAAVETERTVRQRFQIGHRAPSDGRLVWELAPSNSLVSPSWQTHLKHRYTDPKVCLGWVNGWLVYRTHPHINELFDYAFARIRWETDEPALFEVPA